MTSRLKTGCLACLLALLCASCGSGNTSDAYAPSNAPEANTPTEKASSPHLQDEAAKDLRDVSADIEAAKEAIRKREYADAPRVRTDEMFHSMRTGIDRGIDNGFEIIRPDIERLARSLSPDLPQSERVRILVAKVDELTGWKPKSAMPYSE